MDIKLTINDNVCWCEFCNKRINKGEPFLYLVKRAMRGCARINICCLCLKKISKSISRTALKKIQVEEAEKNL